MPTLKPLLVKIGRKPSGEADYPNFNSLASVVAAGVDWSIYVDRQGAGWIYDSSSGHDDDNPSGRGLFDSPSGTQLGVILAPAAFVTEAVAAFPAVCSELVEADLEDYFNDYASEGQPDFVTDELVLNGIAQRKATGARIRPGDIAALDPDDDAPGVRRNPLKRWARLKAKKGITIG